MFCLPHREKFFIATIIIQSLCIALSFTVLAYTTVLRLRYLGLLHEAARTLTYIFLFLAFCLLGIFTLPFLFLLQEITSEGGTSTIPSFGYDIMYAWFALAIACLMRLYVLATRAMLREVRVIEKGLPGLQIRGSKFRSSSSKFRELELQNFTARSRLYRSQILQVNTRWKALAEIYTMHSFAPFSNRKIFVKNC